MLFFHSDYITEKAADTEIVHLAASSPTLKSSPQVGEIRNQKFKL